MMNFQEQENKTSNDYMFSKELSRKLRCFGTPPGEIDFCAPFSALPALMHFFKFPRTRT